MTIDIPARVSLAQWLEHKALERSQQTIELTDKCSYQTIENNQEAQQNQGVSDAIVVDKKDDSKDR
jgi:hypothetical protein